MGSGKSGLELGEVGDGKGVAKQEFGNFGRETGRGEGLHVG